MATALTPLQELTDAASASQTFQIVTEFALPDGSILVVFVYTTQNNCRRGGYFNVVNRGGGNLNRSAVAITRVEDAFRQVASSFPKAALRPDSVAVKVGKGAITSAKIQPVAVQAWYEALGEPVPTLADLARARKAAREAKRSVVADTVALLATGPKGVKEFNRRSHAERAKTDLRNAGLAGCLLDGVKFDGAKLDGVDLTGASLAKASFYAGGRLSSLKGAKFGKANLAGAVLSGCRCAEADFGWADLTGAALQHGSCLRTNFTGANLDDANLRGSDLRGADFTNASLARTEFDRCTFDEQTRWPKWFKLPEGLVWKGTGPDPRLAPSKREKAKPKPTDFAGFLDRLRLATDESKFDKAMAMLRADRFRLFAKVQPDHVVGVVKSQSDPTLVYSCRLGSDGKYACCTQNLNVCGGLRGSPCKHLLVLIVGLTKAGELDPGTAHDWTQASRGQKPALDKDVMTETFLQYKGAEAGEVDWRPTETIPEDFFTT
jgi:uncharacterized protein YjbI with pentapeptide repeats